MMIWLIMMTIVNGGNDKFFRSQKLSSYECHSHHIDPYLCIHSFIDFRGEGRLAEYADGRKKIFTSVSRVCV